MVNKVLSLIAIFFVINSCSSTTIIRISDPEAKIYIDGVPRGKGSIIYSDTKVVGSVTMVKVKKDGCDEQNYIISRNEEFQVGPCIGGFFVLIPWLWIMGYQKEHYYEYVCEKPQRVSLLKDKDK
jgi:hypothetical protein